MVDNHNTQGVTAALENSPNGLDLKAHAVAVKSTPSIDNAEYRAEKPEKQTCDSCDKRDFLHDVMQGIEVNHSRRRLTLDGTNDSQNQRRPRVLARPPSVSPGF